MKFILRIIGYIFLGFFALGLITCILSSIHKFFKFIIEEPKLSLKITLGLISFILVLGLAYHIAVNVNGIPCGEFFAMIFFVVSVLSIILQILAFIDEYLKPTYKRFKIYICRRFKIYNYLIRKYIHYNKEDIYIFIFILIFISIYSVCIYFGVGNSFFNYLFSFFTVFVLGYIVWSILSFIFRRFSHKEIPDILLGTLLFIGVTTFFFIPYFIDEYQADRIEKKYNYNTKSVYVTGYGKNFHYFKDCHSIKNSKHIEKISLWEAKEQGYSECKICKKRKN